MSQNTTTWEKELVKFHYPKFEKNETTDVVIIGAGIAGILSAYTIAKAGKRVVILEKDVPGSGMTICTTACTTQIIDTEAQDLIRAFGLTKTRAIYRSHKEAIDMIEEISKKEKIECNFMRCSNYIYSTTKYQAERIREEYKSLRKVGINASMHTDTNLNFGNYGYIEIKDQAKFHPILFIQGVLETLKKFDVKIYTHSEAISIQQNENSVVVATKDASVIAAYSLTATYQPFDNPWHVFLKKGQYISYVAEYEVEPDTSIEAIYEDMENPYHYIRIDRGEKGDRVIIGGEDHRKELPIPEEKAYEELDRYAEKLFGKRLGKNIYRWSGTIIEPIDGIAFIGKVNSRQMIATAFSGNGMTYAGITANIARDIVEGKENQSKYAKLYDPKRVPGIKELIVKGRDYTEEMIKGGLKKIL